MERPQQRHQPGKVLWFDQNNTVFLYEGGATNTQVQLLDAGSSPGSIDNVVYTLGSGASASQVIGAWRRGTDDGWVYVSGAVPVKSPLLEDIRIDGATGILINITGGPKMTLVEVNPAPPAHGTAADCSARLGPVQEGSAELAERGLSDASQPKPRFDRPTA